MGLLGWFVYAFGASLTLVRDDQGASRVAISVLSVSLALGGVVGSMLAPRVVRRLGRGNLLRASSTGYVIAVLLYASGGPLWLIAIGPFLGSLANGFASVGASAFLQERQGSAAQASITEANLVAAVCSILGTIAIGIAATTAFGWQGGMLLLIPAVVALELVRGRRAADFDLGVATERHSLGPLPGLMWWSILTVIMLFSIEFCLLLWGADLLRARGGLDAAAASSAIAAIGGGIILGRLVGSRLLRFVPSERALLGSVILAGLGFTWLWFTAEGAVMILALTITGVGMGLHSPLGIARTMRASGGQPDRAAGLVNAGMAVTSGIAPFALAGLADGWGVHQAFLLLPLFFCVGLTLLILKPVPEEPLRPDAIDPNALSASH
ncbi:MAG: MFS transporter [Actinomycetales bacterium]